VTPRPYRSRRLAIGGGYLHTLEWEGAGPALVLLPGAGGNALLFAPLAGALPNRHVIAVDPPGLGESPPLPFDDLVRVADAVAAVAGDIGRSLIWGGHSWGGKVAAIIAGRHPETAAGAILLDPSPATGIEVSIERFVDSAWDGMKGPWPSHEAALATFRELPQYRNWSPALEAALIRGLRETPAGWTTIATREAITRVCEATLLVDNSGDIGRLACPALYVVASESAWWQAATTDRVMPPHVERVELPGHHLIYVDNPDATTAAVASWLARHAPVAGGSRADGGA
jgi:pimeloyl-ACP methyl ester carboxylesterase